jgi:hypothetical protein
MNEQQEKHNEIKEGVTPCDLCSSPVVVIIGSRALCSEHSQHKISSVPSSLKSAGEFLADNHSAR